MQVMTFQYHKSQGWSPQAFPDWDSDQTLVMVFGAPSYKHHLEPFYQLSHAFRTSHIIGCSTAGEIYDTAVSDETLSVAIVRFEHTRLRLISANCFSGSASYISGNSIAQQATSPDLRGLFVLSDGVTVNGSEMVSGINAVIPPSIVVTGGLAGDGIRFGETWVIKDGRPQSGFITAVGLYGDSIQMRHGSKGGWDTYGSQLKVTSSYGNRLYTLEDESALSMYKQYLGPLAAELPSSALLFPLAIRETPTSEKVVVRTILSIDENDDAMIFAGDIKRGQYVQFMKANFDHLIQGASQAAELLGDTRGVRGDQTLSVAISCIGRRLVLKERSGDELQATLDVLPDGVHQIGFYSYGEISPYASGHCDLHNQTMTLTTFSEQ